MYILFDTIKITKRLLSLVGWCKKFFIKGGTEHVRIKRKCNHDVFQG